MFSIQQILTFFLALTMEMSLTACGREAAVQSAPEPPAQAQETPAQGPSPGASEPESEVTEGAETYRGFRMEVYYDTLNAHYCLNLWGKMKHTVSLGTDALGNLIRIENEIAKFPARLDAAKIKKAETLEQIENAKAEFAKPFPYEGELKEKTERLNALNIELNLDEKDTPVMDTEPEQSEEQPEKRSPAHVR